jgi:WhiB family redox-sensing transcriptional regulator
MTTTLAKLVPRAEAWDWQVAARCRMEDPSVFFSPENERGRDRRCREDRAKKICAECPVIDQCRQHALANQEYGVWGGLAEEERRTRSRCPRLH